MARDPVIESLNRHLAKEEDWENLLDNLQDKINDYLEECTEHFLSECTEEEREALSTVGFREFTHDI